MGRKKRCFIHRTKLSIGKKEVFMLLGETKCVHENMVKGNIFWIRGDSRPIKLKTYWNVLSHSNFFHHFIFCYDFCINKLLCSSSVYLNNSTKLTHLNLTLFDIAHVSWSWIDIPTNSQSLNGQLVVCSVSAGQPPQPTHRPMPRRDRCVIRELNVGQQRLVSQQGQPAKLKTY